ncbi:MAG TPA: glycoside hydrolase family 2 TIM barrel-domain containing protein [Anaerolineae bacterium]|nr:glycoside hydrolase family 2 TIM barrel-domain containing protein [Anaerolineae bacterium]
MSFNSRGKVLLLISCLILIIITYTTAYAAPGRWGKSLSGEGWKLWLDREAEWVDDELYLPPVTVSNLPVNPPTCGWENFDNMDGKIVSVPGTVEEYYWSANSNPVGRAGDYRGVSWWSTTFRLDPDLRGKRIILAFESVNLRAEVYVNRKLVGYDIIGNTPFDADITSAVTFDRENHLDIRITDPGGNFSWPAHIIFPWGKYMIPIVRGFGGITGDVTVKALDAVHVDDIYVQNKPNIKEVEVFVTLGNSSKTVIDGKLSLSIHEWNNSSNVIWEKTVSTSVSPEGTEISIYVKAQKAQVWGLLDPHLYVALITFESTEGSIVDTMNRRFGFRWFDIGEKDGDQRLYLNGKRVFMMASVNRGYWPTNGMYASPEYAKKDVETAIKLGYNSIAYHNAIGHQLLVRYADEYGLLATGESAGYRINDNRGNPWPDEFTRTLRREKLFRFIKRDRSYPSIIAYMLKNEDNNPPDEDDFRNMARVRELDPTRILLYTGDCDRVRPAFENLPKNPLKLFYTPNDPKEYYYGWFDMHHWNRQAGYIDYYYNNPRNYMRLNREDGDSTRHIPKDEIIFYGEEGAFGTMLRLGKIKEQLDRQGTADGWREQEHIDWYNAFDAFLDEAGFRTSFPTVDHLTEALAKNMYYFHGRIIENARISNIIDAYNLNGWASAATHTDIVDAYRNPTGDPSILSYYNQPLYVAVKIRDKVLPVGVSPVADVYIVNEVNLSGKHTLELDLTDPEGHKIFAETYPVTITGGEEYGQLLVEEVIMPPVTVNGYYVLNARIVSKKGIECTGFDDIFAVNYKSGPGLSGKGAVIDTTGAVNALLKESRGITLPEFTVQTPQMNYIIVGTHNFREMSRTVHPHIMEQVANGATLVVIDQADQWAQQMNNTDNQAIQFIDREDRGSSGRLFVGKSKLLRNLPVSQSMNWEYQVFYERNVWGLNMGRIGNETVVALAAQNQKDIITAVARIPFGNGQVILCTLTMLPHLDSDRPQSSIAKKLFLNFLEYSRQ